MSRNELAFIAIASMILAIVAAITASYWRDEAIKQTERAQLLKEMWLKAETSNLIHQIHEDARKSKKLEKP